MKKQLFLVGIVSALFFSACQKEIRTDDQAAAIPSDQANPTAIAATDKYVSNEVLVKFKRGASATARANALERINGNVKEHIVTNAMKHFGDNEGFYVVHTPLSVLDAIGKAKGIEVEYAEPNWIYTHGATSTDTYFSNGSLWGMYGDATSPANQFGSQAGEAWANNHTGSASVYVGIIDEGVMWNHEDLSANCWVNPYDPSDGVDNDGNGYTDDTRGWDFDGNDNSTFDGTQDDHGTHVAGTIGAASNGKGVAGVCWNVTLITAKFLGRMGGTTANAVKSVDYFTDLKTRHGLNIVATNNSWGGGGYSSALYGAIERANAADILFIAAAGNGGSDQVGDDNDVTPHYPSSYSNSNIIAVASINSSGNKSGFSNFGAISVDIGAPGSGIYSTVPSGNGRSVKSGYASFSGTSMATPHVTGGAALRAAHSADRGTTLKNAIINSAVSTGPLSGKCVTGGRLNVSGF
jgi:subtilisin family serine protease